LGGFWARPAQVNVARMRAPLDDPVMAGFVARLAEINALADQSPGFVWRLQTEASLVLLQAKSGLVGTRQWCEDVHTTFLVTPLILLGITSGEAQPRLSPFPTPDKCCRQNSAVRARISGPRVTSCRRSLPRAHKQNRSVCQE
jgi:Domain of unknown function (DUF3291)